MEEKKKEINALREEEIMLKSKAFWFEKGEENLKIKFIICKSKENVNTIWDMRNEDGEMVMRIFFRYCKFEGISL
jgi:hypothetical protein